jgi:hypothetical protein
VRYTPPGRHKSAQEFRRHLRAVAPALDCELALEDAAGPLGWPLAIEGGAKISGGRLVLGCKFFEELFQVG